MNDGVAILLERVKTHPEEFVFDDNNPFAESKWRKILDHYKDYLDPEDVQALKSEMNKLIQEKFTAKIMEELFDPKPEEQLTLDVASMNIKLPNATLSAGTTHARSSVTLNNTNTISNGGSWMTAGVLTSNTNSLTLGATTINESHLEHIKAHMEALQKQKKPHKTLFGKLFNYL